MTVCSSVREDKGAPGAAELAICNAGRTESLPDAQNPRNDNDVERKPLSVGERATQEGGREDEWKWNERRGRRQPGRKTWSVEKGGVGGGGRGGSEVETNRGVAGGGRCVNKETGNAGKAAGAAMPAGCREKLLWCFTNLPIILVCAEFTVSV